MAEQPVPLRVYQTESRIMVAAPMPGLEPENIAVTIGRGRVAIHGDERGPHQHERRLLRADWAIGPYDAEVALGVPVEAPLTNVTYGNGIVVVVMPKAQTVEGGRDVEIRLARIDATRGERVGHAGRVVRPATTREHVAKHRGQRAA